MKDNKMGKEYSIHWKDEKYIQNVSTKTSTEETS
jgi:hypothetical protein